MKKEIWKSIVGYDGLYEVSNIGNVRSLDRVIGKTFFKGRNLKLNAYQKENSKRVDYRAFLNKNNKQKTHFVSRLVATSFIGDSRHLQVNHKDGNPLNNNVNNLEWVTPKENMKHARDTGLLNSHPYLCNKPIISMKNNESMEFNSLTSASKELGVDIASISMVLRGFRNRKTAGGYIFRYK